MQQQEGVTFLGRGCVRTKRTRVGGADGPTFRPIFSEVGPRFYGPTFRPIFSGENISGDHLCIGGRTFRVWGVPGAGVGYSSLLTDSGCVNKG